MKPQIVSLNSGVHNEDLQASTQRIIEGGSWKKQRVAMLIPASAQIPTKVYLSHCGLIFPPNQPAHRMAAIGLEVGEAFSNSIQEIVNHPELGNWEYLLTIEHDNVPQPDGLVRLIQRLEENPHFACVSGLYWTKGPSGVPQIWGDPTDPVLNFRPMPPDPNGGLVECNGTGMGFALWRLSMFKDDRLRKPWFKTLAGTEGVGTQDLYFWGDARKHGYRCAVDCSVRVGHYDLEGKFGPPDMMW
jgi:hypothetical protein